MTKKYPCPEAMRPNEFQQHLLSLGSAAPSYIEDLLKTNGNTTYAEEDHPGIVWRYEI